MQQKRQIYYIFSLRSVLLWVITESFIFSFFPKPCVYVWIEVCNQANAIVGYLWRSCVFLNFFTQEYQTLEKTLRAERDQIRDQLNATKNEVENLRGI